MDGFEPGEKLSPSNRNSTFSYSIQKTILEERYRELDWAYSRYCRKSADFTPPTDTEKTDLVLRLGTEP
jgi:hypothetical protein